MTENPNTVPLLLTRLAEHQAEQASNDAAAYAAAHATYCSAVKHLGGLDAPVPSVAELDKALHELNKAPHVRKFTWDALKDDGKSLARLRHLRGSTDMRDAIARVDASRVGVQTAHERAGGMRAEADRIEAAANDESRKAAIALAAAKKHEAEADRIAAVLTQRGFTVPQDLAPPVRKPTAPARLVRALQVVHAGGGVRKPGEEFLYSGELRAGVLELAEEREPTPSPQVRLPDPPARPGDDRNVRLADMPWTGAGFAQAQREREANAARAEADTEEAGGQGASK